MRILLTAAASLAALAMTAPASADHHMTNAELTAALAADIRAADRARDQFRHPAETLEFFRIKPGMTVADVVPGGGWYTRLLVPYLGAEGQYIGLNPDVSQANSPQIAEGWGGLAGKFPDQLKGWGLGSSKAIGTNLDQVGEDWNGKVDRVVIFREMHNLNRFGLMYSTLTGARRMLKDDGMLGIVQHRAKPWAPGDYTDGSKGYLRQSDVIGLVEAHGFELVGTSEINANAMDPANHERGVWEMPPSLGTKRDDLKNLGESDRMTLLFRKR